MYIETRVKKLEKIIMGNKALWAVFTIGNYPDAAEEEAARRQILDAHLADGNPHPTHCLYVNEVPSQVKVTLPEQFLYSFTPIATGR